MSKFIEINAKTICMDDVFDIVTYMESIYSPLIEFRYEEYVYIYEVILKSGASITSDRMIVYG